MYFVYALYSSTYQKIYIGYTSNIKERIKSHNQLATKGYTVKYRPWELVHLEEQDNKTNALQREKQLKSAQGRKFIWELIHYKLT